MGLNEILEMAYRYHGADGALNLLVKQPQSGEEGSSLQVVVGIPADSAALAAYDWCREQIGHAQAHNHYSNLVREGFESGPYKACLVELALIYRVHLAIKTEPSRGRATVTMVINTNQNEQ
ncbi:MAG: hypothetical protein MJE77_40960 [Proteobacteria bacterium]|nr:hypothetical protein [Pseudomonadota bacterium]